MVKIKVSEATRLQLDWLVLKAQGEEYLTNWRLFLVHHNRGKFSYTTDWAIAGPIIERENIDVNRVWTAEKGWQAANERCKTQFGPTPLIAALRCFIASRLGDEVEVPEELV